MHLYDSGGIARPHVERLPHLGEQGAAALLLRGIDRKDMGSASKKQVMFKPVLREAFRSLCSMNYFCFSLEIPGSIE